MRWRQGPEGNLAIGVEQTPSTAPRFFLRCLIRFVMEALAFKVGALIANG